jgi:hypothetical protein
MIDKKNKEIYVLWWEYLKRSERYRKFCNWWKHGGKKPLPDQLRQYHQPMWNTYMNFGDVNSKSFEKWWKSELDNPLPCPYHPYYPYYPYYPDFGKNIIDYRSVIEKDIYNIYRKLKKEKRKKPSIKELMHNIKMYMTSWEKERLYILVEFQHASIDNIVKEFHRVLSKKKKEPHIKEASRSIKGMKGITTIKKKPSTTQELQRYLRVYDCKKRGLTIPQIANEIQNSFPKVNKFEDDEYHYNPQNVQSAIKRDLRKAKKIISNVELGYFPGDL